MDDQITITVAKRIVLGSHKIWRESSLEEKGREHIVLCDSISQEEFLRLCVMVVIEEGYITKLYPLPRIIIRPGGFF